MVDPKAQVPFSRQTSIGVQRQLGETMAVEADYAYTGGRREYHGAENMNLSYDPVTGVNYPFTDISRRPDQNPNLAYQPRMVQLGFRGQF